MITHNLKKLPKNTYEIDVLVPSEEIKKESEKAFDDLKSALEVRGFRKGKVPSDIARKNITNKEVNEQVIRKLLPKIYEEIVRKEGLKPVVSPRVEIIKAEESKDWEFRFTVAEKPLVTLDNYKEIIKKVKVDEKKSEIWVPGKNKEEPKKEEKEQKIMDKILFVLLKDLKVEISDLIIEEELNKRLSKLVDDVQKIGLTVDSYLKSKNTTIEALREQIKKEIIDVYSLEFILMEIADQEKITVEEVDLEKIFANIKDPKEKEMAKKNAYFYASIIRKQKTIEYLIGL